MSFKRKLKLLPAKKAWKKLSTTLHCNLRKLKRSKTIKRTATGLNKALSLILRRPRPTTRFSHKRRTAPIRPPSELRHRRRNRQHQGHHRSFASVYVDDLYNEPARGLREAGSWKAECSTSSSLAVGGGAVVVEEEEEKELDEVDLRAEMFIARFKEEMRLQRQRSFGEYQEMLARGL